jgi:hypothetical protein
LDVIFTIVSRNYAAQAATLMESLVVAEPGARRVVVATDGPIPQLGGRAHVIDAGALGAPVKPMSVHYSALELNTAVKPFVFKALLTEPGVSSAVYLDPDIYVFRPLDIVRARLAEAQLVLTPHLTRPLTGDAQPNDRDILRSGTYNLGFAAMRREAEPLALLDWWAERCRFDCRSDPDAGLFTDQRWMDLAPGFVDSFGLIRDPGLNLAYWNLEGRALARTPAGWTVDGQPLTFFHFSGFDPRRPLTLSKHQNRVKAEAGSPLAALLADYAEAMLRNGHEAASAVPYAHNRFASGRTVTPLMRRTALAAARRGAAFENGLDESMSVWFDQASPEAAAAGLPDVTRLMDQAWRESPGADPFDRDSRDGRLGFHRWFADNADALGVDAASLDAAKALLDPGSTRVADSAVWSEAPWTGLAARAGEWLREPSTQGPPRAVKALLAARQDLRARFPGDANARLAWCLGPEAAAGRFAADLLPDAVLAGLVQTPEALASAARFADPVGGGDLRRRLNAGFGHGERAGWPTALLEPLRAPWLRPAAGRPAPFPVLFQAIWDSRGDLQRLYPLDKALGRFRYLRWLLAGGFAEYGVETAALPRSIRDHPMMRAARWSLPPRSPGPTASRPPPSREPVAHLVVVEKADAPFALSAGASIFEASSGRFLTPHGTPASRPPSAGCVYFLTEPGLVAADFVTLHARGVSWTQALGVWPSGVVTRLTAGEIGLGFVDAVASPGPTRGDLPRPVRSPRGDLETALAALAALAGR